MTLPAAVLFDFDFTLADSSGGIFECVKLALEHLGLGVPPRQRVINTIGLTLSETFAILTGSEDPVLADRFVENFHGFADDIMTANTDIFVSVETVLARLRAAGIATAIVSTKRRQRIEAILLANELNEMFDVIIGSEDVSNHKPDPEGLLLALDRLEVGPDAALYVGDHVVDSLAADRAGIAFVAVLTGVHTTSDFQTHSHRAIVAGIDQIPEILGIA